MKVPKCSSCVHYQNRRKCKAYPEGIPKEIIWWQTKHDQILKGQSGNFIFESKYPEQEKAAEAFAEKYKKKLFENKEKYLNDFIVLLLKQLKENNLQEINWERIVLEIHQKRGWDTIIESSNFYVETNTDRINLECIYFKEWRRLRKRLWQIESISKNKDFIKMKFELNQKKELQITGLEVFKL